MVSNDDQIYITKEWDIRLDEDFLSEVSRWHFYLFWFNDSLEMTERTCCFPILSQKWGDSLLLYCVHLVDDGAFDYCDTWLMDVDQPGSIRAVYIPDIFVEHIAAWAGLAPQDATAQSSRLQESHYTEGRY